ncbi:hypothetical protein ACTQ5Z_10800, partial [Ligilactobacillus ruminis]
PLFILLVFLVFLVNLNYTWEMSTWLSFFYQFTPLYGQNVDFWDLPVKHSPRLRAKRRFLGFARKTQPPVTGKMAISGICP